MPFPYSVLRCLALAKNKDSERWGPCRGSLGKVGTDGRAEMETNPAPFLNMPIRLAGDLVCEWMVAGMDSSTTSNQNRSKNRGKSHDG